jgi:hypothetical protein
MVIIEIKRDFDDFNRLLGEHRWNEFLKNPSAEERDKVTRVYYCVYNSGRQVQKNGVCHKLFFHNNHRAVRPVQVGKGLMLKKAGLEGGAQ